MERTPKEQEDEVVRKRFICRYIVRDNAKIAKSILDIARNRPMYLIIRISKDDLEMKRSYLFLRADANVATPPVKISKANETYDTLMSMLYNEQIYLKSLVEQVKELAGIDMTKDPEGYTRQFSEVSGLFLSAGASLAVPETWAPLAPEDEEIDSDSIFILNTFSNGKSFAAGSGEKPQYTTIHKVTASEMRSAILTAVTDCKKRTSKCVLCNQEIPEGGMALHRLEKHHKRSN